jgi:hypothetical protein
VIARINLQFVDWPLGKLINQDLNFALAAYSFPLFYCRADRHLPK